MGKLQEFQISFSDGRVVYGPGDSVVGSVRIRTAGSLQYRAIKVNCQGSCGVSSKMNDPTWAVEEQYFNSSLSVADKGTLAAGEHTFPFHFLLPAAVPTSFEGPFGKVLYCVKASIDTPRFAKDHKSQRQFYLLNLLDLNQVPTIQSPSSVEVTKKFSVLLVKTGTLRLRAKSNLRGYVSGQIIHLSTEVHNQSSRDTSRVLASLVQKVTYRTKRPVMDLRTIAEVEGAGVRAGGHVEWREQMVVPPLPQSSLDGCSLIHIDYFIQVSLKSPDVSVTLPIFIGDVPLNLSSSPQLDSAPSHIVNMAAPSAPPCEDHLDDVGSWGKSPSQQDPGRHPVTLYPDLSQQLLSVSTSESITTTSSNTSFILQPEHLLQEAPPTYEESCSSAVNSRQ